MYWLTNISIRKSGADSVEMQWTGQGGLGRYQFAGKASAHAMAGDISIFKEDVFASLLRPTDKEKGKFERIAAGRACVSVSGDRIRLFGVTIEKEEVIDHEFTRSLDKADSAQP